MILQKADEIKTVCESVVLQTSQMFFVFDTFKPLKPFTCKHNFYIRALETQTLELYNITKCCFASPKLKLQIQIKSYQQILFKDVPMFKILVGNCSKCRSISLGNHYRWLAFQTEHVLFLEFIPCFFVHRLQFVLQFYLKLFN